MESVETMLCFSLYEASRATVQVYRGILSQWSLTYPQYLVLRVLHGGQRTMSELGTALRLDSGTLSPLVRRLERSGYVDRYRDADDERVVRVVLSARGIHVCKEMESVPSQLAECTGLDSASTRELVAELRSLVEHLTRSGPHLEAGPVTTSGERA